MTDRALWLWLDTETSGLIEDRPTMLEVAWMITDDQLQQLTPLRQRLTLIGPPLRWLRPGRTQWPADLMGERVQEMHRQSGLARDWASGAKITEAWELDTVIRCDLNTAQESVGAVTTHLAGAGIAQFEARLLQNLGSQITTWCHYRTADVSVAAMVMGLPKIGEPNPDDGLKLDIQAGVDVGRASTTAHRAAADVRIAYRTAQLLRRTVSVARGALESR